MGRWSVVSILLCGNILLYGSEIRRTEPRYDIGGDLHASLFLTMAISSATKVSQDNVIKHMLEYYGLCGGVTYKAGQCYLVQTDEPFMCSDTERQAMHPQPSEYVLGLKSNNPLICHRLCYYFDGERLPYLVSQLYQKSDLGWALLSLDNGTSKSDKMAWCSDASHHIANMVCDDFINKQFMYITATTSVSMSKKYHSDQRKISYLMMVNTQDDDVCVVVGDVRGGLFVYEEFTMYNLNQAAGKLESIATDNHIRTIKGRDGICSMMRVSDQLICGLDRFGNIYRFWIFESPKDSGAIS